MVAILMDEHLQTGLRKCGNWQFDNSFDAQLTIIEEINTGYL